MSAELNSRPAGSDDPEEVRGYVDMLRRMADFRRLWSSQVVSFIGNWFNTIALYAAVQDLTSSGRAIALVMVAKTLPIFLMTPFTGPIVDRFDRRRLLMATDLTRCGCALGLIASHQAGSLVGLYGCAVLMMVAAGVAVAAKNSALPMVVPRRHLARANALSGGAWSATLAIGAASGGLVTEFLGIDAAFALDAGTFLISIAFISRLPALPPPGRTGHADERRQTGFVAGLRYLSRHGYVLSLASLKAMMQIAGGMVAIIPLYGTIAFSEASGSAYVGLLYGVRGVGAIIGALWIRALFGDTVQQMRRLVLVGYLIMAVSYAGLGQSTMYWHAALVYFTAALGQSMVWVFSGTLLQIDADSRFHGRVFAIEFGAMTLVLAISSYSAGAAVDWGISLSQVATGAALLLLVPALSWAAVLLRIRR